MLLYLMGLLPMTHLMITLRPTIDTNSTGKQNVTIERVSFTEVLMIVMIVMIGIIRGLCWNYQLYIKMEGKRNQIYIIRFMAIKSLDCPYVVTPSVRD